MIDFKHYFENNHRPFKDALNATSLALAFLVLLLMSIIAIRGHRLVNRVTFRIQAGIAFSDIVRHLHLILMFHVKGTGFFCTLSPFMFQFSTCVFILLNVAVAMNLHLVILLDMRPNLRWQRYYWISSFSLAIMSSFFLLAFGLYGETEQGCDFNEDFDRNIFWSMTFRIIPYIAGMAYTLGITIFLIYKLHYSAEKVVAERNSDNINDPIETAILLEEVRSVVYKVGLYPAAFFISLSGYAIFSIYDLIYHEGNLWYFLQIWSSFSLRSAGTLNFIAFFSDFAFNTGIFIIFKSSSYTFDQPYRLDKIKKNPTHEFNINQDNTDIDNSTSNKIHFRQQDRHLGTMDVEEFIKFL